MKSRLVLYGSYDFVDMVKWSFFGVWLCYSFAHKIMNNVNSDESDMICEYVDVSGR